MPELEIQESVNRCTEAFQRHRVNHDQACKAFLAELPILSGPAGFHAYLACIAKAAALGVIDLVDIGRYCHVAQLAMRAWTLAHPLPPKGNHESIEGRSGTSDSTRLGTGKELQTANHPSAEPIKPHPLPSNGNHSGDDPNHIAAALLPDLDTQKAVFKSLRHQGFSLPSNSHLRNNPVEALYYCGMAGLKFDQQPPSGDASLPNPGPTPPPQQIQAA